MARWEAEDSAELAITPVMEAGTAPWDMEAAGDTRVWDMVVRTVSEAPRLMALIRQPRRPHLPERRLLLPRRGLLARTLQAATWDPPVSAWGACLPVCRISCRIPSTTLSS